MKFLLLIALVSCSKYESQKDLLHEDALSRKCTIEQLKMVDADFIICAKSSYFTSHCYDIAKVSYCSKKN